MLGTARCRASLSLPLSFSRTRTRDALGFHALRSRRAFHTGLRTRTVELAECYGFKGIRGLVASQSGANTALSRSFSTSPQRWSPSTQDDSLRKTANDLKTPIQSPKPTILSPRENIYNIPNFLTASRLVAAPVIGYLIVEGNLKWALGLFFYASVTDLVDGWMARRFHLQTVVGSVIDPMADKLLMTVMTITLAIKGLLPAYLATLILGRDIALAIAAIYYRYASLPQPKTLKRYWDFSLPSAEVRPTTVSKYNTFLQLLLIGGTLALPVVAADPALQAYVPAAVDGGLKGFQYLVAATTAWSGLSYAVLKNAVRIIGDDEALKARQGATGRRIIGVLFGGVVVASAYLAVQEGEVGSA